jgi:hypothetical protein
MRDKRRETREKPPKKRKKKETARRVCANKQTTVVLMAQLEISDDVKASWQRLLDEKINWVLWDLGEDAKHPVLGVAASGTGGFSEMKVRVGFSCVHSSRTVTHTRSTGSNGPCAVLLWRMPRAGD